MKNLLIFATSTLCMLLITAVPVPSNDASKDLEIVQIPLQGNKVSDHFISTLLYIMKMQVC